MRSETICDENGIPWTVITQGEVAVHLQRNASSPEVGIFLPSDTYISNEQAMDLLACLERVESIGAD